jgi:hypothetical protein
MRAPRETYEVNTSMYQARATDYPAAAHLCHSARTRRQSLPVRMGKHAAARREHAQFDPAAFLPQNVV